MIHIIGKGNGEAEVFEDESPPPKRQEPPEPNILDVPVKDDDLRPAGSNAAPPLTSEQAGG